MFVLDGSVKIGAYVFKTIHEVSYVKSVNEIVDTAVLKLPTSFKIRQNGELKYTEEAIKIGDKVAITIGYENKYRATEFVGYVRKIKPTIPLEIHCEDEMWLLRRKTITKAWNTNTNLKEVLTEIVKGTTIKVAENIPDIPLDNYIIRNANGTQVLQHLKKNLRLTAFINDRNELYCGLAQFTNINDEVIYDLNYNLIENNLEFKSKEERKIRVRYTYINSKGVKKEVEFGDTGGELRCYRTSVVSDVTVLEKLAQTEIEKLKYNGFEGTVKTFLIPYATRGMKATLLDQEHLNREGSYFIKKVVTYFGTDGANRVVTIGKRLNG
ncbi:late control protein [Tenacibaculum salmonis]|uniref:late control protein n=1 Tax=Tenacibaculum sp. P3-BQ1 TaxID=3232310 RepID=UPI0034DE566A